MFKKGKRRGKKGSMKSKALSPNSLGMDPMKKSSPPHYQNVYRNKMSKNKKQKLNKNREREEEEGEREQERQ